MFPYPLRSALDCQSPSRRIWHRHPSPPHPHHHCTGSPLTRLNQVSRAKQLLSALPASWGCLLHLTLRGAPRHACGTDISKCSIFGRITPACLGVGFLSTRQESPYPLREPADNPAKIRRQRRAPQSPTHAELRLRGQGTARRCR